MTVKLPLPRDPMVGEVAGTVIASVWLNDLDEPVTAMVLILRANPGEHNCNYAVCEIEENDDGWTITCITSFTNIVPAVARYVSDGGDY